MATAEQLNTRFGIKGQLNFCEHGSGLIVAEISNPYATATLCLQGAHLMNWQPRSQAVPVIWLSKDARLSPGKSIRGGVPVCWPWFGAHASEASFPGHGYARTVPWRVMESGCEPGGATRLTLRLMESEKTRMQWKQDCTVDLTVVAGETLRIELATENTGHEDFIISEALHTYFRIGDISAVQVKGLDGAEYWDKAGGGSALKKQTGAITFSGETDRVYINSGSECVIQDEKLRRNIHIAKSGSRSTVVWTPWADKAGKMGDLGQPDGWREMVCIESGNAMEDAVKIPAGTRHTLVAQYRAEPM